MNLAIVEEIEKDDAYLHNAKHFYEHIVDISVITSSFFESFATVRHIEAYSSSHNCSTGFNYLISGLLTGCNGWARINWTVLLRV